VTERVTAEAVLRARDGTSVAGAVEPPTSDNIDRYVVEDDVVAEAIGLLRDRGIEVLERGPVSLSIGADKDVFETVFQTSLEGPGGPPQVPSDMRSVIAEVILPIQPTFYP
jgi:hypothetical protein